MRQAVFFTLILATNIVFAQRNDTIQLLDGKQQSGEILTVAPDAIQVMMRNRETPIKVSNIKSITFAKEPSAMRAVRNALKDGQTDQAVAAFARIDASKVERDVIKQEIEFFAAQLKTLQAKEGTATAEEAKTAVNRFRGANPQSWRSSAAMEMLGELAMQTSDYKTAATTYARLGKISAGLIQIRSHVRSADALRAMGDSKNAMAMYRKAISAQTPTPQEARQKQMATIGAMSIAAAGGQAKQAVGKLHQIIENNDASDPQNAELFAKAYNALGDCHRGLNQPLVAVSDYLHTDLLFYRDADMHAESLYWLGKIFSDQGKSQRAQQKKKLLKQRYANSPWAKKT